MEVVLVVYLVVAVLSALCGALLMSIIIVADRADKEAERLWSQQGLQQQERDECYAPHSIHLV